MGAQTCQSNGTFGGSGRGASPVYDLTGALALVQVSSRGTLPDAGTDAVGSATYALTLTGLRPLPSFGMGITGGAVFGTQLAKTDGTQQTLPGGLNSLVGETASGDLAFRDARIFRRAAMTIDTVTSQVGVSSIESVSGNFIKVRQTDDRLRIHATSGDAGYYIKSCNQSLVTALSATEALVDDCDPPKIDMTTGARSTFPSLGPCCFGAGIFEPSGPLFLSTSCPPATGGTRFCAVAPSGTLTAISTDVITPRLAPLVSSSHVVFFELNGGVDEVSWVRRAARSVEWLAVLLRCGQSPGGSRARQIRPRDRGHTILATETIVETFSTIR